MISNFPTKFRSSKKLGATTVASGGVSTAVLPLITTTMAIVALIFLTIGISYRFSFRAKGRASTIMR
jgi:hypothetical protein